MTYAEWGQLRQPSVGSSISQVLAVGSDMRQVLAIGSDMSQVLPPVTACNGRISQMLSLVAHGDGS